MTSGTTDVLQRLTRSSAMHRSFLELQSQSHTRFLTMCRSLADAAGTREPGWPDPEHAGAESVIDLTVDAWLHDHRPNWTVPAVPMMSIVDKLAQAAAGYAGADVVAVSGVRLLRWLPVRDVVRTRTHVAPGPDGLDVELWAWRTAATAALSRFELVAAATVRAGTYRSAAVAPFAPLTDAVPQPDPYGSGMLFHGPSFQYLTRWSLSAHGATGVLDASRGSVPHGLLHQGLLDGALHVIPAQALWRWSPAIGRDVVGIPHRLDWLELYGPLPDTGEVRVEARFAGFDGGEVPLPAVDVQLLVTDRVVAAFRLVLGLPTLGRLAVVTPTDRRTFLADRHYVPDVGLSSRAGQLTTLTPRSVMEIDWPPGAVADIYALPADTADRVAVIAAKEHLARKLAVHPGAVTVAEDLRTGWVRGEPGESHRIAVAWQHGEVRVRSVEGSPT